VEKSDHFDGSRFVNPTGAAAQSFSAVPRMLLEPRAPWPVPADEPPRRPPALDGAVAIVTFIGHSTFLIQTSAGNILTDPISQRRSVERDRPRRVWQPAVPFDDLPAISMVLLSHNHYDHCDLHAPQARATVRSRRDHPISERGARPIIRIRRVEELIGGRNRRPLRSYHADPGAAPSARSPLIAPRAVGGFVLMAGGAQVLFAGDTAYAPSSAMSVSGSVQSTWRLPIGATSRAGSCSPFTRTGGGGAGAHGPRGIRERRHAFRHIPTDNRGYRRTAARAETACRARNVPPSRFRTLRFGEWLRLA
jgi:hypothetical protein